MIELGAPAWPLAAVFGAAVVALVAILRRYRRGREVWRYDPRAAWLRAGAYFAAAWSIAAAAGTLTTITGNPVVFDDQPGDLWWVAATIGVAAVVVIGYWVVWPIGTRPHGRRVVPETLLFGVLWGVSEGLLFGSVWVTAERFLRDLPLGGVWVALATIVVLSAFVGLWHALYWDVHVAPEHNVIEWNIRKVLFVHNPNVILCTIYVTVFGNLAIYVGLEALALLGSTVFMRFPSFVRPLPPDPDGPALGPPTSQPPALDGRVVVCTGAAGGIGRVVTAELAALGAHVVLVDVDERALAEQRAALATAGVDAIAGDLSTRAGVDRLADELLARYPRIDVLINNAGVFCPRFTTTPDGFELSLAVNHLGHFLLTHRLLDRLVDSHARVLFVSSDAHRQAKPVDLADVNRAGDWKGRAVDSNAGFAAYNQSKLLLTATALELAERTRGRGITVNVLTPGALVPTQMYRDVTGPFAWFVRLMRPWLRTPDKAARTYVYLATSPEVDGVTGWYWQDCRPKQASAAARDPAHRREWWEWSERAVGLVASGRS